MPESTTSAGDAAPPVSEDQAIRQRVKGLTSQVLQEGRFDPDAVRDVVRAMIGGIPGNAAVSGSDARELLAEAVRGLDEALVKSASATHGALQLLASRGKDFTDNDLKEALICLSDGTQTSRATDRSDAPVGYGSGRRIIDSAPRDRRKPEQNC